MTERGVMINGSGVDRTVEDETDANEILTNGGYDETANNGGYNETDTNGGYNETATNGGYNETATNGGYNETTTNGGSNETTTNGGSNETTTNGGYNETTTNGGYNETTTNGGYDETTTNGGDDETTTSEGDDETTTSGEDDETIVIGLQSLEIEEGLEAVMPVAKDDPYYNMNHQNRGMAIILNHEYFVARFNMRPREGTNEDVKALDETLKKLGFDVREYKNSTVQQINEILSEAGQHDHSDSDCFVLVCLTHGYNNENCVLAYDGFYNVGNLWKAFTANKCPSLAGKPKLFFIQACRGPLTDVGITLRRTQVDSDSRFRLSTHADFLVGYATIPGLIKVKRPLVSHRAPPRAHVPSRFTTPLCITSTVSVTISLSAMNSRVIVTIDAINLLLILEKYVF